MSVRGWRHLNGSRALVNKALLFVFLGAISLFIFTFEASSLVKTDGILADISWDMSPNEVIEVTSDHSRHTKIIKNGIEVIVLQRQRITDSDIAGKSLVEYTFSNNKLNKIKITKAIKYWPDFILEQLLYKTVSSYRVGMVMETLYSSNIYRADSIYHSTVISLGYGKSNKPQFAYIELKSKV